MSSFHFHFSEGQHIVFIIMIKNFGAPKAPKATCPIYFYLDISKQPFIGITFRFIEKKYFDTTKIFEISKRQNEMLSLFPNSISKY